MTFQLKKRLFDLVIAVPSVIFLSPVLVLIGFFVWMKIGTPVLFKQVRPGLHDRPFTIYKFCTMTDERDGNGKLLSDTERLTPLGRFLRKTSMDELPEQARRHGVNPGITGLAQVNGCQFGLRFHL